MCVRLHFCTSVLLRNTMVFAGSKLSFWCSRARELRQLSGSPTGCWAMYALWWRGRHKCSRRFFRPLCVRFLFLRPLQTTELHSFLPFTWSPSALKTSRQKVFYSILRATLEILSHGTILLNALTQGTFEYCNPFFKFLIDIDPLHSWSIVFLAILD